MKKVWKILLITIAFVLLTTTTVSAASSLCSVDKTTVSQGETVKITVSLKNEAAVKAIGLTPVFDDNIFELVSAKWLTSGTPLQYYDEKNNKAAAAYPTATKCNGEVFEFSLRVKGNAAPAPTTVKADLVLKDNNNRDLPCGSTETTINIVKKVETSAETAPHSVETAEKPAEVETAEQPNPPQSEENEETTPSIGTMSPIETVPLTEETPENRETEEYKKPPIAEEIPMDDSPNSIVNKKNLIIFGAAILICLAAGWCLAITHKK